MSVVAILPARMAASRFPGKPLANILGMPMIGHCYFRACAALGEQYVFVATCDSEVRDYIQNEGGRVVMTSSTHKRATSRTAEALELLQEQGLAPEIVIMIQGDEPLVPIDALRDLPDHFADDTVEVVNLMTRIYSEEDFYDKNNVKVVVSESNDALYFSRAAIPSAWISDRVNYRFMQTGIIAFRPESLRNFNKQDETTLEIVESIDMNRILERGGRIRMALIKGQTLGVDTPADLERVERLILQDPDTRRYMIGKHSS